jgi:hypothetical protein
VNGIREFAVAKHAEVTYVPIVFPDLFVDKEFLEAELAKPSKTGKNLFAFPA